MEIEMVVLVVCLVIAAMAASYLFGFLRGAEKANLQITKTPANPLDTLSEALAVNKIDLKKLIKAMASDDHPDQQKP